MERRTMERRDFLKLISVGTGAAAATVLVPETSSASPATQEPDAGGYQETAHVRRYYRLCSY